jgi:hypothetical protein
MAKKKTTSQADSARLVSFKLAKEPYDELEKYAANQNDEMGNALSPSQAARRLMLEALKRQKKN